MKTYRKRLAMKKTHNHEKNKKQEDTFPRRSLLVKHKKNAKKNALNVLRNPLR